MKRKFRDLRLSKDNKKKLDLINSIVEEYQADGYKLTLRQLYYQLVSRDVIPNNPKEYKKLSGILVEGRMGGFVDWSAIEDRVRKPEKPNGWSSPTSILKAAANQYRRDRMKGQQTYIECWVEKDALSGVLSRVTEEFGINIMVNRGYSSASAMYDSYSRIGHELLYADYTEAVILYLGDFDPSGQDMIRDIEDRLLEFYEGDQDTGLGNWNLKIVPLALTKQQIRQYAPPPNPAKVEDSRAAKYIEEHGNSSWEVDALRPEILNQLLRDAIENLIDGDLFQLQVDREESEKNKIYEFINQFNEGENDEDNEDE